MGRIAVELCGKNAGYQANPRGDVHIDLVQAKDRIEGEGGRILADAGVLLVAQLGAVEVSVYRNGKLLIKTTDKRQAEEVANALYGVLGVAV